MDYFEEPNAVAIREKKRELIAEYKYDVIGIHMFDYDNAAHPYDPESKQGLSAISLEAQGFRDIVESIRKKWGRHKTLPAYAPDHGQHRTMGGNGMHGTKLIEDMNILHFFGKL